MPGSGQAGNLARLEQISQASREMAGAYALCAAAVGLMFALAPEMAWTSTGFILLAGLGVSGLLLFFFVWTDGLGLLYALAALFFCGGLPFAAAYGLVRWLLALLR